MAMNRKDSYLRRVVLRPYAKGHGPSFALTLWETGRTDALGKSILRYRFTQCPGILSKPGQRRVEPIVLFTGTDFACAPGYALDSNRTAHALINFLTLKPGDTDADYFAEYTPAQLKFAEEHAEAVAYEAECRLMNKDTHRG